MEDDDFRSRFMFMPFFYDLRAIGGIGNIYHKLIETYDDETTSNDSDLLTTDDIIMKTQNLVYYKSKVVVKITWYNIVEFGDVTNQVSLNFINNFLF